MNFDDVANAVRDRDWYALLFAAIWATVWVWRRYDTKLYPKIPTRLQWAVPLVLAAATAFVDAYASHKTWKEALALAVYAVLIGGLGSMGIHSALQNSSVPYAGLTASERKATGGSITPKPPEGGSGADDEASRAQTIPTIPAPEEPSSKPPPMAIVFVAALCFGCAGSLAEQRAVGTQQRTLAASADPGAHMTRCATLDDRRVFYGGVGKGAALLGGGAGLATVATEDSRLDTGLAIGSVAAAAVAVIAVYISESSGDSWARDCE